MSETVTLNGAGGFCCTFELRDGKWYDHESDGDWGPIVEDSLFAYALTAVAEARRTLATKETALSTVQDLHREAVAQRDQVTRELEEAKVQLSIARAESKCLKDEVDEAHALAKHWIELHITARRDALHEAKAKVETLCIDRDRQCFDCGDSDRDYLAQQILALLGAEP